MKKTIFLLLLLMLLHKVAGAYDFQVNGICYNVNGTQATVTYYRTGVYSFYSGDVVIPEEVTYSGTTYTITAIGESAFYKSQVTSISIPNTVTSISSRAFYQCYKLTNVAIPNSVITIDDGVFYDCKKLVSVSIGNSVTTIGGSAFYGCTSLKNVVFPNSVTNIGESAFKECTSLTSVIIPNSVISIGSSAFYNCSGLTSLTIGNSVTTIGSSAFYKCAGLTTVVIPNSVISIGSSAFSYCTGLTCVTIGNSVTTIGSGAFSRCSKLTSIDIPESVTSIEILAFGYCTALETLNYNAISCANFNNSTSHQFCDAPIRTINIGDQVQKIPAYFANGKDIKSLIIPSSVNSIESYAFHLCDSLETLTISCSVSSIARDAFYNGSMTSYYSIKTIYITGEGEWNAGTLPENSHITTLCIGEGITAVKGIKVNPLNIYCYAAIPPLCDDNSFTGYKGTLHVPATSLAAYFTASYWENFTSILGNGVQPQAVNLNKDSLELELGDESTLTAAVAPATAYPNNIIWTSSNSSIAMVNDGVVTAVGVGECDIIATCLDKQVFCHVIVKDTIRVELDQHEAWVLPNHIITLFPTVLPVTMPITVSSSDPSVAAARVVNDVIQIVGVKEGTTIITVSANNGLAQQDTCQVTVFTEPGDMNCDGFVNISDVTSLIDYLLSGDDSQISTKNADVNGDESINISDVTTLIDILLSGN